MDNLNGNANGGNEILEENSIVPQELFIISCTNVEMTKKIEDFYWQKIL